MIELKFSQLDDGSVRVDANGSSRFIGKLGDLKAYLDLASQLTHDSIYRLGLVAVLLAVRALWSAGMELNRSNIFRTLDEYYFVFQDESKHEVLERGLDDGIEAVKSDLSQFEAEVWRKLVR